MLGDWARLYVRLLLKARLSCAGTLASIERGRDPATITPTVRKSEQNYLNYCHNVDGIMDVVSSMYIIDAACINEALCSVAEHSVS